MPPPLDLDDEASDGVSDSETQYSADEDFPDDEWMEPREANSNFHSQAFVWEHHIQRNEDGTEVYVL